MSLEGRRVHGHEHVGVVPRSEDVMVRNMDLERRNSGDRTRRRPYLCREVRQRRQVVAEKRRAGRETVPGQLHPVAGVAGKPDDHAVQSLQLVPGGNCVSQSCAPW